MCSASHLMKKSARLHFTISCSHIKLILIIQHDEFLGLTDPAAKTKPAPAGAPVPAFHDWVRCRAHIAALSYPEMLARPSLYSPTHPILLRRWQPTPHQNQSTLVLPAAYDHTAASSPAPVHSCPRPRRRPPPRCARHGAAVRPCQHGQHGESREDYN